MLADEKNKNIMRMNNMNLTGREFFLNELVVKAKVAVTNSCIRIERYDDNFCDSP